MCPPPEESAANLPPLQIGITGGIGAGKSTVCRIFAALGIPVYDADSRARSLQTTNSELIAGIQAAFGPEAYLPDGSLNRSWLAAQVFDSPDRLALLNDLVHPRVAEDYAHWVQQQAGAPYVLKEAALLFEAGSYRGLDATITVSAPEGLRLRRTLLRDAQRSRQQVQEIMERQLPEGERLQRADFKIVNDEKTLVLPQVLRLHRQFLRKELPARQG
ncbi:dephospho-CoA kinase [Cesiribacter andamanensis]|uniref:Dephospho-CoA kinase n=1 Tax=Cesiribacter andamanensis AMV16 TaxID=1279009 RepID=M7N4T0_9BACT|nr:dephospho-CoA kinase [Cesiribacter andamanensis]EMR02231.1 Dephospho-CoA kinase [Cesiribacter andamanensis AMV16]